MGRRYITVNGQAGPPSERSTVSCGRLEIDVGHGHDGAGAMVGLGALAADSLAAAG